MKKNFNLKIAKREISLNIQYQIDMSKYDELSQIKIQIFEDKIFVFGEIYNLLVIKKKFESSNLNARLVMGGKNSKAAQCTISRLDERLESLVNDVQTIQNNVNDLPNEFLLKNELNSKIDKVEEDTSSSSEKLNQLLEITKDQQQVIIDLGQQYAQLFEGYQTQQEALEGIIQRCDEKLAKYEEELRDAQAKLGAIEKEVIENSELTKALGIRKTDNMIKKEKMTPVSIGKRSQGPKGEAKKSVDEKKLRTQEKQANTQSKKNILIEVLTPEVKKINKTSIEQENEPNFLDIIRSNKRAAITPKETLSEIDINTLL